MTTSIHSSPSKNSLSKLCILLIACFWAYSFNSNKRWEKNPIEWDVVSYYAYLPSAFIYHDITLNYIKKDSVFFGMKIWPEKAPNGGKVIKTSMGVSYLYAPFFFLGHLYAKINGYAQDGFSVPYQVFLQIGTLFYLLLGFVFLRSFLLNYFKDPIVALVIISLFFGTNLLYYSTGAALMAHAYVFFVSCVYIWSVNKWHYKPEVKSSVLLGLSGGLLTVMRPTLIIFILFALLFGITNIKTLSEKINLIKSNKWMFTIILVCYVLPGIPQIIYWKYITGHWLYFSYTGETFFWGNPHILKGLFSYRNGWLLYTPIMTFSILGIFFMRERIKKMRLPVSLMLGLAIYIFHSWWCWWHGGFGLRAYIDIYAVLAIPMGAFYEYFLNKKIVVRIIILLLTTLMLALNIFQTWQFEKNLIHFAWMTKKAYWMSFLKTEVDGCFWLCLSETDCDRARAGLSEVDYEKEKNAVHTIKKELLFEKNVKVTDSLYYSSDSASDPLRGLLLNGSDAFSPSINLSREELLADTSWGVPKASAQFYYDNELGVKEGALVISIEDSSGIYYYKEYDFYTVDYTPNQWNTISAPLPIAEIKNNSDLIKIYVWTFWPKSNILINKLRYEIVTFKGS